jgi:hypothetical protein
MLKLNSVSNVAKTLICALTVFATGCDGGEETENRNEPLQLVEMGITAEAAAEMVVVADLVDSLSAADFLVYTANDDANQCGPGSDAEVDSECGVCKCQPDGSLLCIDFTCEGPADMLTPPPMADDDGQSYTMPDPSHPTLPMGLTDVPADAQQADFASPMETLPLPPTLGLTNTPATCFGGYQVGDVWDSRDDMVCYCLSDLTIACTSGCSDDELYK